MSYARIVREHNKLEKQVLTDIAAINDCAESDQKNLADIYVSMYIRFHEFLDQHHKHINKLLDQLIAITASVENADGKHEINHEHTNTIDILEHIEHRTDNLRKEYRSCVQRLHDRYATHYDRVNQECAIGHIKLYGDIPVIQERDMD